MVKMLFLASRYNLSDELVEDCIYDRASFQEFLDIDITTENVPDATTLCRFRTFLNDNGLQEDIFQIINYVLEKAGLMVKE
jgi:IS5 family transposase